MYVTEGIKVIGDPAPFRRAGSDGLFWIPVDTTGRFQSLFENEISDWPNLSVVGYGAVVYAATIESELLKTTDGGDGSLSVSELAPRLEYGSSLGVGDDNAIVMSECSPASMFVYFQNLSCAITTLRSISIAGLDSSEYSFNVTDHSECAPLPDTAFIALNPHAAGTYSLTLTAHYIDDEYHSIDTSISFTLVVNPGTQPTLLSVGLHSTSITTAPNDTLEIPVYLSGNATLDTTNITLPFGIDTNVLWPIGFHSVISGLTNDTIIYSNGTANVLLRSDSITLNGETLIGYLRCIVYLGDALATNVTLTDPSLTSFNAPCIGLTLATDSVNVTIGACGDQTLLHFMKTDSISIAILSIAPNPVTDAVQINLIHPTASAISYQVIDALGETCITGATENDAVSLDVSSLPQGVYFFRASSPDGIQTGKQFVIMR